MATKYLHEHPEFDDLIRIVADDQSIPPVLVEKDYWIMHVLYGLQRQGMKFYLKGGTSLSKGHKLINRFSEDIDLLIEPPSDMKVAVGRNQDKEVHRKSRENYYDWLSKNIAIAGITSVERDKVFDDEKFRSGGIRLQYPTQLKSHEDVKVGILLEVGFDTVSPNSPIPISSWAYEYGKDRAEAIDNRAMSVPCYDPGYTLVEKLQTISTKFRKQQASQKFSDNFMRHYYDVYHLLGSPKVQEFIGTNEYVTHKENRFRAADNMDIMKNQAFKLTDPKTFEAYKQQYLKSQTLYYKDKPEFEEIMSRIDQFSSKL